MHAMLDDQPANLRMIYCLDYNGTSVIIPDALRRISTVRYVETDVFSHPDIKDLYRYLAWVTSLRNEFSQLQFLTTSSFREWMFSPYTQEEFDYASKSPLIPRIVLASSALYSNFKWLKLLRDSHGRAHVILEFFFIFRSLFPEEKWPHYLMPLFSPTEDEPLPLMLRTYREQNAKLKVDYPCRNDDEKASYLSWALTQAESLFPEGVPPTALTTWLHSPSPRNTSEGISRVFAGISAGAEWKRFSLATPLARLRFAAALMMYWPATQIYPWQWEELCRPYAVEAPFPKHAAGVAAQMGIDEEQIPDPKYRRKIIGLYLVHALPLLKRFGLPEWFRPTLFEPACSFLDAEKHGISELMVCLALAVPGGPQLQTGQEQEFIRWYLRNDLELHEDMFAAHWQVRAWMNMSGLNAQAISEFSHVFFNVRQADSISVLGWAGAVSGVGEDCRTMFAALKGQNVQTSLLDITPLVSINAEAQWTSPSPPYGSVNIICLAAQDIYRLRMNSPAKWWAGRYNIGLCPWELPVWPKSTFFALEGIDAIWAPSTFVAQAFAACGKPVTLMPHAIRPQEVNGDLRRELGISTDTVVFLTCYDSNASYARKNPLATIHAFNQAFAGRKTDVRLLVKTMNAEGQLAAWQELRDVNQCGDKVVFLNERFGSEKQALLMNTCNAFVSLHRSEGFGRLLAEAMSLGKLLIASNFGGNTDFTTAETACPVNGRLVDVKPGEYLFGGGQQWFETDIAHAAQYMRDVATNPSDFAALAENGRRYILEHHSPETIGRIAKNALMQNAGLL